MSIDTNELILQFGQAIGGAVEPFLPVFKRLMLEELIAVKAALNEGKSDAVLAVLHNGMTLDELAAEKAALVAVTNAMADTNAARRQAAQEVLMAILKAALSVALGLVAL